MASLTWDAVLAWRARRQRLAERAPASSDGRLVRFARPADWLGGFAPEEGEAAARDVVRTYLAAYGPAPREQFQRWFGMTSPAEAGRWLQALGEEVVQVDVEGEPGWMLAEDVAEAAGAEPASALRLLPGFDLAAYLGAGRADVAITAPR